MAARLERVLSFIFDPDKPESDRLKLVYLVTGSQLLPKEVNDVLIQFASQGTVPSHEHLVTEYGLQVGLEQAPATFHEAADLFELEIQSQQKSDLLIQMATLCERAENLTLDELVAKLNEKTSTCSPIIKATKSALSKSALEYYNERKAQSTGLLTSIPQINEIIRGMHPGSMNVVSAYTGHGKTITGICWAHLNAVRLGYDVVYLTLEVPQEIVWFMMLSAHSLLDEFAAQHDPIPYDRIQYAELTAEEEQYVFGVLEPDLIGNQNYGKIKVVEPWDFKDLSTEAVGQYISQLDFEPDALFVDYAQLLKHASKVSSLDAAIFQFYRLALSCNNRRIVVVLLAQANRDGWREANQNEGKYELTALGDSNELERGAYRVFFLYSTDEIKESGEIKIMMTKNRGGRTLPEPFQTQFQPEFATMGSGISGYNDLMDEQDLTGLLGVI